MEHYMDITKTKKIGRRITDIALDLSNCSKSLNSIMDRIDTAWNGDDALKYLNRMRDKSVLELQAFSDLVKKYGQYLIDMPEAYVILDEVFSSKSMDI